MSAIATVKAALEAAGARRQGRDWTCPAHDDHRASLSVSNGDGRVLIHCPAGCETDQVLAALDLHPRDLFDEPGSNGSRRDARPPRQAAADDRRLDPYQTLVPEAKYRVGFLSEEEFQQFGRAILAVVMQILDEGEYFGLPLFFFLNKLDGRFMSPNSTFVKAYVSVTGKRPPRGLKRHRPSWFLSECELEVEVVTVKKDANGRPHPEALRYSRIARVVARTAGTPPCLRGRSQ